MELVHGCAHRFVAGYAFVSRRRGWWTASGSFPGPISWTGSGVGNGFEPAQADVRKQSAAGKSSLRLAMNACNAAAGAESAVGFLPAPVSFEVVRRHYVRATAPAAHGPPDAVLGGRGEGSWPASESGASLSLFPPLPDAAALILAFSKRLFGLARMILRRALEAVTTALDRQAAIALIRPRQVGKTTLTRDIARRTGALYLDLESAADRAKLAAARLFLAEYEDRLVVLDEIHRAPGLFLKLRGIIDEGRQLRVLTRLSARGSASLASARRHHCDGGKEAARDIAQTIYHSAGTCAMGPGPNAVVDERLHVYGIGGLRVVDTSVMRVITSGNTNAPTIMIAEKVADMIRADAPWSGFGWRPRGCFMSKHRTSRKSVASGRAGTSSIMGASGTAIPGRSAP